MKKVLVYNYHCDTDRGHENRPLAYFTYQGEGGCEHSIEGINMSPSRIKTAAIQEHLRLCSYADPACRACRKT